MLCRAPCANEIVDDFALPVAEHGRPADDLELVPSSAPIGVRAVLDQQLDDVEIVVLGGEVQRNRVVAFVADVGIGAALEQRVARRRW